MSIYTKSYFPTDLAELFFEKNLLNGRIKTPTPIYFIWLVAKNASMFSYRSKKKSLSGYFAIYYLISNAFSVYVSSEFKNLQSPFAKFIPILNAS